MRAKIQQRRQRGAIPVEAVPGAAEEESATGSNGLETQPSLPVSPYPPSPELVQAVVQLIQRVNQLEQVVGGMHQRDSVEIQKLKLKARCEALKRAIEVIPPDSPGAAALIEEVANKLLKWMSEPTPPPKEPPPAQ